MMKHVCNMVEHVLTKTFSLWIYYVLCKIINLEIITEISEIITEISEIITEISEKIT